MYCGCNVTVRPLGFLLLASRSTINNRRLMCPGNNEGPEQVSLQPRISGICDGFNVALPLLSSGTRPVSHPPVTGARPVSVRRHDDETSTTLLVTTIPQGLEAHALCVRTPHHLLGMTILRVWQATIFAATGMPRPPSTLTSCQVASQIMDDAFARASGLDHVGYNPETTGLLCCTVPW